MKIEHEKKLIAELLENLVDTTRAFLNLNPLLKEEGLVEILMNSSIFFIKYNINVITKHMPSEIKKEFIEKTKTELHSIIDQEFYDGLEKND